MKKNSKTGNSNQNKNSRAPSRYQQEQQFQQDYDDPQYCLKEQRQDIPEFKSQLPPLSEIINYRFRSEDSELHQKVVKIAKYAQDLENMIQQKNREIERQVYMTKYLTIAQQKRDEMLSFVQEENRKLKEQNVILQNQKSNESFKQNKSKHSQHDGGFKSPPRSQQSGRDYNVLLKQNTQRSPKNDKKYVFEQNQGGHGKKAQFQAITKDEILQEQELAKQQQKAVRPKDNAFEDKPQSILSIPIQSDQESHYNNKEYIQILKEIMPDEEIFIQTVQNTEFLGMLSIFDAIHKMQIEHKSLYSIVFRLRKVLNSAIELNSSMTIQEAIQKIVEQVTGCLECDRSSVFIFDAESETLWTKIKNQNKIQIPFNMGLVGHVFTTAETLNIMNAYNDARFNKEVDKALNYKTNTILVVPIMDNSNVIGVIQAVNKFNGYFTKDDEGLLSLICSLAAIVLRNSQQFDENASYHNNLRSILRSGVYLNQFLNIKNLVIEGEKVIKEVFNVQKGQILVIDQKQKKFFRYNDKTEEQEFFDLNLGLAGLTLEKSDILNVPSAYNDLNFNSQIDLNTQMPIISMPVKAINPDVNSQSLIFHGSSQEYVAVVQIVNGRGIQGLSSTNKSKISAVDYEYMDFFARIFAQQITNCLKIAGPYINKPDGSPAAKNNINIEFTSKDQIEE